MLSRTYMNKCYLELVNCLALRNCSIPNLIISYTVYCIIFKHDINQATNPFVFVILPASRSCIHAHSMYKYLSKINQPVFLEILWLHKTHCHHQEMLHDPWLSLAKP